MSLLRPLNITRPADSRSMRDNIMKISYVGGWRVRITILPNELPPAPPFAHCRRYLNNHHRYQTPKCPPHTHSMRKNVSKISIPLVGWSSTTMSVSWSKWQATLSLRRSEMVIEDTLVFLTCSSPNSSIRRFIWNQSVSEPWSDWLGWDLTRSEESIFRYPNLSVGFLRS